MSEEIPNLCRICLKECDGKRSIFDSVNNQKFTDLLKKYTGTDVTQSDRSSPHCVCEKCFADFSILVKFVKKFKSTTKKIKGTLVTNGDELKHGGKSVIKEKTRTAVRKLEELSEYYRSVSGGAGKNMVQCVLCGVVVQNRSAFVVHYRRHSGEKPCVCGECGRSFTQSGSLSDHVRRQHQHTPYRYTCEVCGKQFWKKGALTVHNRIHTNEKPYQCPHCPRAFPQFSQHLLHSRTHTGHRPHQCQLCQKAFVSHSALRRHQSVHDDQPKFTCQICQVRLKSKESLKKHTIVMHATEKRNECDLCGAKFSMRYSLSSHMKIKHSDRSGLCSICNQTFSNINKHMTSSHTVDTNIIQY